VLCSEFVPTNDWKEVRRKARRENLLGKGSQARTDKLLRAVERRVIRAEPPLPCPRVLARYLAANVSDAAKVQLLFVLAAWEDTALREAYRRLVVPPLTGASRRVPGKPQILEFLEEEGRARPEVAKWTSQTRLRWAEGFRLVLREGGLIAGRTGDQEALQQPVPREETICLLCHGVADSGVSGWGILRHEVLKVLLVSDADAVRAARALHNRGWWTFSQSDAFIEFRRNNPSAQDWVDHVLGH
jgi:Putative inner membrane protein (DUF1819)